MKAYTLTLIFASVPALACVWVCIALDRQGIAYSLLKQGTIATCIVIVMLCAWSFIASNTPVGAP